MIPKRVLLKKLLSYFMKLLPARLPCFLKTDTNTNHIGSSNDHKVGSVRRVLKKRFENILSW